MDTHSFWPYLAAYALVMTGLPGGRTQTTRLRVVVLAALQAAVVTAAVRRGEVRVPQILGQGTLWTGIKEALPLGLLYAHLGVPHPSSYLGDIGVFVSKGGLGKTWCDLTFTSPSHYSYMLCKHTYRCCKNVHPLPASCYFDQNNC